MFQCEDAFHESVHFPQGICLISIQMDIPKPKMFWSPDKHFSVRYVAQKSDNEQLLLLIFFPRQNSFWAASVQTRCVLQPCLWYRKVNTGDVWKCFKARSSPGTSHKNMFCFLKHGLVWTFQWWQGNGQLHSQTLPYSCFNDVHRGGMGFGEAAPPWETALWLVQDTRGLSSNVTLSGHGGYPVRCNSKDALAG